MICFHNGELSDYVEGERDMNNRQQQNDEQREERLRRRRENERSYPDNNRIKFNTSSEKGDS